MTKEDLVAVLNSIIPYSSIRIVFDMILTSAQCREVGARKYESSDEPEMECLIPEKDLFSGAMVDRYPWAEKGRTRKDH
jgi:hypothetical protein